MAGRDLLRVEGAERIRALSKDLRRLELDERKEIRQRIVRQLKEVADEIVRAERAAVRALPSKGENARRRRWSLRAKTATATVSRVRTTMREAGVSVVINPKRMPAG